MFGKAFLPPLYFQALPWLLLGVCGQLCGQSTSPRAASGLEFPVTMRQSVVAGKTAAGTKVQAKLTVATLVNGVVVPSGAILSGEVTESSPVSPATGSRLAIRVDSAKWKNGSVELKAYLTAWYYATQDLTPPDLSSARHGSVSVGAGQSRSGGYPNPSYPNPSGSPVGRNAGSVPFPGRDPDDEPSSVPAAPAPATANHRAPMKDVDSVRSEDGSLTLTSTHFNLKLDKQTVYVIATSDLLPRN